MNIDQEGSDAMTVLKGFSMTLEEVQAVAETYRDATKRRDRRVCACGHSMTKHQTVEIAGRELETRCYTTKLTCPCLSPKPVILASDVRPFLRRTKGSGQSHALMLGIAGLVSKEGRTFEWLEGWPRCELEALGDCTPSGIGPYAVSKAGQVTGDQEAYNFLLCVGHGMAVTTYGMAAVTGRGEEE
jgi:hypothetical protein